MTATKSLVLLDRLDSGVVVLTLNRPEKHNALNDALLAEMSAHLTVLRQDESVRVLIITGAQEKAFCAGRDMTEGIGSSEGRQATAPPSPFELLRQLEIPTIAAVNGYAFGGGALLALMCDLRVAARSATFRFPGVAYGLVVGTGLLASIIGPAKAKDLIFSARVVHADEALALGLVNRVADVAKEAAYELAATIAHHSAAALAASKRLIDRTVRPDQLAFDEAQENRGLRTAEQAERFGAAARAVTGKGERE